jgi:hypothetical protein
MNILMQEPEQVAPKPPKGMLLHCGAKLVNRNSLYEVPTPKATRTWFPLSHTAVLNEIELQLRSCAFEITEETHALSHNGDRYFGVLSVSLPNRSIDDFGFVVGLRNSHDQTYPAGLVAGTRVFVCDNLAFSGEVRISRKHTRFAERDLRHLTARAVGQLGNKLADLDRRVLHYKETKIRDPRAHDIIVRAVDAQAITTGQIAEVLREWRTPSHEEFKPRSAWSLFNAFTEVHKTASPQTAVKRGEALYGLFDTETGAFLGRN